MDRTGPVAGARRSSRDRDPTPKADEPRTLACNEVIDIVTGERRDGGTTCLYCWRALYDPNFKDLADYVSGEPGDGTDFFTKCDRLKTGTIHCGAVSKALLKLETLAKSRAAGNR